MLIRIKNKKYETGKHICKKTIKRLYYYSNKFFSPLRKKSFKQ